MVERDSISTVVGRLADILEQSGETYAFGGALALAAWSEPRATADVDVVIWVSEERLDVAIDIVRCAGAEVVAERARHEAIDRGMFVCRLGGVRVDSLRPTVGSSSRTASSRAPSRRPR